MQQAGKEIRSYVHWQIKRITQSSNENNIRADLAKLRRGIGKKPGAIPELWTYTLEGLPDRFVSKTGKATQGEWAIYTAITLYSLHQQGLSTKDQCMCNDKYSFAKAIAHLIENEDDLKRIKRRFDATATSQDMTELAYHVRGLIQQLRSRKVPFNYPEFAEDLYWFQFPAHMDNVLLRWGQDFYREYGQKADSKNDQEEKKE